MGLVETVTGQKHTFNGIGKGGATLVFLAFASSPALSWLTQGAVGKVIFWLLTKAGSWGASQGLVIGNIGVAKLEVIGELADYNSVFDEAFKTINSAKGKLTDEQIKAIDQTVMDAFDKFSDFNKHGAKR